MLGVTFYLFYSYSSICYLLAEIAQPFVTKYRPSVPDLKNIIMSKWHLLENKTLLTEKKIKNPPMISYRKGKSLKDILVRAKL